VAASSEPGTSQRLRAVVVDDEPAARASIVTLLGDEPRIAVVALAANGGEAVATIRRERPDVLFLDVQMPDLDGFGVLDALGEQVPRCVIFVTAHDDHALRAFEVHALDYVLKPFGRPRFRAAVDRAIERVRALDALTLQRTLASIARDRHGGDVDAASLVVAGAAGSGGDPPLRRLTVRENGRLALIELERIDWIEACDDYVRLHTPERTHLLAQRMHALERMLPHEQFVRTHRSIIVRIDRIRALQREADGGGSVVLENGVRLRVARGRWDALRVALGLPAGES
jgi:two-component system LytT family response regulator